MKNFRFKSILILSLGFLSLTAEANEKIVSRKLLLQEGYKEVKHNKLSKQMSANLEPHSLAWPVQFQDQEHSLANAMAQYQPFGDPYFHGGCDLRVHAFAEVRSPVSGKLEAGHYSYDTNEDGSLTKFWKPWPQAGDSTYFEVAVITEDGTRYEFHHVSRDRLPEEILKILRKGGGTVPVGTLLGYAIPWGDDEYHHIHYNIILPNGTRLNPEYASPLLADHKAPDIKAAFAVLENGSVIDFQKQKLREKPKYFAVALIDQKDKNIYEHPASMAKISFATGEEFAWDFRKTLSAANGSFPRLWDFFIESIETPDNEHLYTDGGYGTGLSIIKLPVSSRMNGKFTITVSDIAGNETKIGGEF